MTNKEINELFGIKESYQLVEALETLLQDKTKREILFDKFIDDGIDLSHDCLRDYFQNEHAARSELKQDYTPDCLCDLIAQMLPQTEKIIDICTGTGSLSIGTGLRDVYFQCEEFSKASIQILLFNISIRNMNAIVCQKDVLKKQTEKIFKITKSEKYSNIEVVENFEETKVNAVISNPPYSLKWDVPTELEAMADERFQGYSLAPKKAADYAFVLDGISRLTKNGTAFYILPAGVLFRGSAEGRIRQQLVENNLIDTIISLPDKLFLNTSIPVYIMVFKKGRTTKDILFIDASKEFKKGGKQNTLDKDNIDKIVNTYKDRKNIEKYSHCATVDEIKENDYNLNISRYVDTYEKPELPSINEITKDLISTHIEEQKATNELVKMLNDLAGNEEYNQAKDDFIKYIQEQNVVDESMLIWMQMQGIEKKCDEINKQSKRVRLKVLDIADFERVKKGKIYDAGTTYIQLSATDGKVRYLYDNSELDTKYGVFIPKEKELGTRYLFYAIEFEMEEFLHKYQCGMNINPDIFKYLEINYVPEKKYQYEIIKTLDSLQCQIDAVEDEINANQIFKQYHLDGMFV